MFQRSKAHLCDVLEHTAAGAGAMVGSPPVRAAIQAKTIVTLIGGGGCVGSINRHAPTIEKWPAGPNFGRPYLQKFWVFLAGKKCNELGKKCSVQLYLYRSQ